MHPARSLRRLTLGAVLAGAALVAVPAAANAATTCSYTANNKRVTINYGDQGELRITRSGQFIAPTAGGVALTCSGATVTNTELIHVIDAVPGGGHTLVLDESQGVLGPGAVPESDGNSELEVLVQGFSAPSLRVVGTPQSDTIRIGGSQRVMFGNDPDVDVNVIAAPNGAAFTNRISVSGGGGSDFISGRGGHPNSFPPAATVRLFLDGDAGDDTLVDGVALATGGPFSSVAADTLRGGPGSDTLFSVDGNHDGLQGNEGFDTATHDIRDVFNVDPFTGTLDVEQRTLASVGRLRLNPAAVAAKAGGVARVGMSWTHPKDWRKLRSLELRVMRGSEPVGRVVVKPATDKVRADGALALAAGSRVGHHGKTVTAKLAVRLPKALVGEHLRLDVEATDRRGRTQLEPAAGAIEVR